MGWTFFKQPKHLSAIETVRQELTSPAGCPVVADAIVGGTYYGAMRSASQPGAVVCIVCLIEHQRGEIGLKFMDESMGPYYFGAPAHVLAALTPTDCQTANEWRAKCGMPAGEASQQLALI